MAHWLRTKLIHKERYCSPKHSEEVDPTALLLRGHDPAELADKVSQWAKQRESDSSLSAIQRSALAEYRTNPIFKLSNIAAYSENDVLRAYFPFFDKMFFGGMLEGYCELRLTLRNMPFTETYVGLNKWGICWLSTENFLKLRCCICVGPRNDIYDAEERCLSRISALLHEMVHAFLRLFGRLGDGVLVKTIGLTGHGPTWQDVAHAVEMASRDPDFLNLHVELHREWSFAREHNVSEGKICGAEATKWGFDGERIDYYLTAQKKAVRGVIGFREMFADVFRRVRTHYNWFLS